MSQIRILLGLVAALAIAAAPSEAGEVVLLTSFPKELFETYRKAFEARHPGTTVVVKSKETSAAVAYLRETRRRPDTDLFWASATDAFAVLASEGLLSRHALPMEVARRIPEKIGAYPIHDPGGCFFGFALSGYGMMWNRPYLQTYRLPAPKEWPDLVNPVYRGHLGMSSPSRSGTTHLTVESILQEYGWSRGWEFLLAICGNMAAIADRSFGVPQGVINGEFGIGVVIDFFGLSAMAGGYPVDFAYPSVTPMVPAGIGLVKGGPNPEDAKRFLHFLLSEEGQLLLFDPGICRLPVIPDLYAKAPKGFPNPFTMKTSGTGFDVVLSQERYDLINSLFDHAVTFRLRELKEAWKAVHEADEAIRKRRSRGEDVSGATAMVGEARSLVGRVPLEEKKATDPVLQRGFSKDPQARARWETEWDAAVLRDYTRAKRLATQAME